MKQIFILGASTVYGVGAAQAGWADLVKQYAHGVMYGPQGTGEQYEVFNFGKSGATVDFVLQTFPEQLAAYGRGEAGDRTVLVAVGGNNSKAEGQPGNYVCTPEDFYSELTVLFALLRAHAAQVVAVPSGFVDESKTTPKADPLTGGKAYFTNARRQQFAAICQQVCAEQGATYAELTATPEEWIAKYLYKDGLHPNQAGHERLFEAVKSYLAI